MSCLLSSREWLGWFDLGQRLLRFLHTLCLSPSLWPTSCQNVTFYSFCRLFSRLGKKGTSQLQTKKRAGPPLLWHFEHYLDARVITITLHPGKKDLCHLFRSLCFLVLIFLGNYCSPSTCNYLLIINTFWPTTLQNIPLSVNDNLIPLTLWMDRSHSEKCEQDIWEWKVHLSRKSLKRVRCWSQPPHEAPAEH